MGRGKWACGFTESGAEVADVGLALAPCLSHGGASQATALHKPGGGQAVGGLEFLGEGFELSGGDSPTLVEAHLGVGLAIGGGPVDDAGGVAGFASAEILKGEDAGHEGLFGRLPRGDISVGEDEALVGDDFEVDAAVGDLLALGALHGDDAGAARSDIDLGGDGEVRRRGEPLGDEGGFGPAAIEFFARSVEDAGENQFAVGSRGGLGGGGYAHDCE